MITNSGILVTPENEEAPTIEDIALSLGRHPRFGGHTKRWWTVLHHSLLCEQIGKFRGCGALQRIHLLIHDGHESVTCDVPTTWKDDTLRLKQYDLDVRIYRKLRLPLPDSEDDALVSSVDIEAVVAEGFVLGPPRIESWFGIPAVPETVELVEAMVKRYPNPEHSDGLNSRLVVRFLVQFDLLMKRFRDSVHGNSPWSRQSQGQDSSGGRGTGTD